MVRQTGIAQTIDMAADKAKYDECAKKILTYESIIAWILKSCTKEFSQYSVSFIAKNCIQEKPVISRKAVHQDQLDKDTRLDGDMRIDGSNTEANSIKDQTVYYDIRFKACAPGITAPIQLIINLEIQLNDTPGYPLVTRGFYYCARMISEQYGTVFTDEHYEKLQKVYSIWICPDPAKKRKNGIFRYRTVEESLFGSFQTKQENY
ncbi:MAG: Rpn family recombination-promoting nuclease/putative transposase, partial [Acetatifactor sp.]|nr:Rpn family recombination-promoting nuclease/putative transposase [Acetatifactor sp.]